MLQFSGLIWFGNKNYVNILELWCCHFLLIGTLKVLALVSFILCNLVLCKTEQNNLPEIKTIITYNSVSGWYGLSWCQTVTPTKNTTQVG